MKFAIDDTVFFMYSNSVEEAKIIGYIQKVGRMTVRKSPDHDPYDDTAGVIYVTDYERGGGGGGKTQRFTEDQIFATKKELLKSL